jgi:branched-chain amino acid transport system substrate-binding protein
VTATTSGTGVTGTPTALGTGSEGRVFQVSYNHYNMPGDMGKWQVEFKQRLNDDLYTNSVIHIYKALGEAMAKAKSTDPVKVASSLSGLKFKSYNGDVEMRKTDHQLQQPLFLTRWQKADAKFPYSAENTGMTLAPVREFPSYVAITPTSCDMKRPR